MLPIHGSLNVVRDNFARQFTPDGDGYVYRRRQRGEAFRVTAAERDAFVAAFDRGIGRLFWGGLAVVIALIVVFEVWPTILPVRLHPWHETIVAIAAVILFLTIWRRLSGAPDHALDRRVAIAGALDAAARRRVNFAELPWTVLITGAVLMMGLIARALDPPGAIDRAYIVGGAIGFVFFVLLGVAKWRITRS